MKKLPGSFVVICLVLLPNCVALPVGAATQPVQIVVQASQTTGRSIPSAVFGSNLQWEADGDGVRSAGGWQAGLIEAMQRAGVRTLRFPGGALANHYRWKSAVGPAGGREKGRSFGGAAQPQSFGTDEFLALAAASKTMPVVTVNLAAGAEEAADWVEYMNGAAGTKWGGLRVKHGHLKPAGVRYWEVGNEIYSPNENGYLSAEAYAQKLREFAKAMRARDPSIKVGAALEASFQHAAWMKNVYPHLLTWNETVLKLAGKDIDFVSLHFYAPFDKVFLNDDLSRLVWAGADVFDMTLKDIRAMLAAHGKPGMEIAVTEYGTFFGGKDKPDPRSASTEGGLFGAMILMRAMEAPDIVLANHWSLINNNVFGMWVTEKGKLVERPMAAVFRALSPLAGGQILALTMNDVGYAVSAKGNVPALKRVSAVRALAANDSSGRMHVMLVNRQPAGMQPVELSIAGKSVSKFKGNFLVPGKDGMQWSTHAFDFAATGGKFTIDMPPHSFAVLSEAQ